MRMLLPFVTVLALGMIVSACGGSDPNDDRSAIERALPMTTQGYREGGIVGAVEGFTGGVLVICRQLDGTEFSAAIDAVAVSFDVTSQLEAARAWRHGVCVKAAALNVAADLATNPIKETEARPIVVVDDAAPPEV